MSGIIWGAPLFAVLITNDDTNTNTNTFLSIKNLNNWDRLHMDDVEVEYDSQLEHNHFSLIAKRDAAERFIIKRRVVPNENYTFNMRVAATSYDARYGPNDVCMAVCSEYPDPGQFIGAQTEILVSDVTDISSGVNQHYDVPFYSGDLEEVYLVLDLAAIADFQEVQFDVSAIALQLSSPISYAKKPFNLNILSGDIWNFIAVEPGAWFYSAYDDYKTHHVFLLAGNEFKLLEFQDADGNGVIPRKEYHSAPITLGDKQYHVLHLSRTVDSVCPFPTQYYPRAEFPSDEYFYEELSEYSINYEPFERGDALGLLALRNLLSANSGDVNIDLDDIKALLKGYMVEERQNPYLDDPNLDDTGHPTVSYHD